MGHKDFRTTDRCALGAGGTGTSQPSARGPDANRDLRSTTPRHARSRGRRAASGRLQWDANETDRPIAARSAPVAPALPHQALAVQMPIETCGPTTCARRGSGGDARHQGACNGAQKTSNDRSRRARRRRHRHSPIKRSRARCQQRRAVDSLAPRADPGETCGIRAPAMGREGSRPSDRCALGAWWHCPGRGALAPIPRWRHGAEAGRRLPCGSLTAPARRGPDDLHTPPASGAPDRLNGRDRPLHWSPKRSQPAGVTRIVTWRELSSGRNPVSMSSSGPETFSTSQSSTRSMRRSARHVL
jgi:hypothetical protein